MNKHTQTPWKIGKYGDVLNPTITKYKEKVRVDGFALAMGSDPEAKANSEHIVRCVNSHEALVKALKEIRDFRHENDEWDGVEVCMPEMREIARAALAAAGAPQ